MNSKVLSFLLVMLVTRLLAAQSAPDEDTGPYTTCNPDGANATRTCCDLPNAVNVGTIDDRSCYANYKESNVYGKTWGVYNITDGSNQFGNTLQPRIERSLSRAKTTGAGSYARFTGTVRILEVGDASGTNSDGSYLIQAKGKHTGGGGSPDPAICLYLAKPVYGTGALADEQVAFNIYAERILFRGGEGSGREIVFLKTVTKNEEIDFELEVGFRKDPNDNTKKVHYCDAVIGGDTFNWNIPEPEKGIESGIRYGVYRVKGGRAQMRWANTTYQKVEVPEDVDSAPSDAIFRLRNVATGKFLTDTGASAAPVLMTDSGENQNTHWTFVESGAFYNIDSEINGILRAPGANGPGGAFVVVSTAKGAPASDTDKTWTIQQVTPNEEIYRFQSRTSGRFLYHQENGEVTHIAAPETDDRSKWEVIPTSESLGVEGTVLRAGAKIYPNPARGAFTVKLGDSDKIQELQIYDILGKQVHQSRPDVALVRMDASRLPKGLYLVRILTDKAKVMTSKLLIK